MTLLPRPRVTDDRRPWRPTASLDALRRRAAVLAAVRRFFKQRGVLEVETPALGHAPVPDLHLGSFEVRPPSSEASEAFPGAPPPLYLQTSPEYAMKRLLAAGSGAIFQICRAYRAGEAGSRHNPEFTMLEWYRPGWSYRELMDEVEALVAAVLPERFRNRGNRGARRLGIAEAFSRYGGGVDPHRASAEEIARAARGLPGVEPELGGDRLAWLDYLMSFAVEPALEGVVFLYDYPADQAALARVRDGDPQLAERFELYVDGVELANGWTELTDPAEQRRRFEAELEKRRRRRLPQVPLDERFLAALEAGLPECAGVALGLDRLVMLALGAERLEEVWAFPGDRA